MSVAEAFSDEATLRHMLRFAAALAPAAAEAGLIPKRAASVIAKACNPALYDPALYDPMSLAQAARRSATLTVPVVKARMTPPHDVPTYPWSFGRRRNCSTLWRDVALSPSS